MAMTRLVLIRAMRKRMRTRCSDENGFTVVELIVALSLIAILGASLFTMIGAGKSVFARVTGESDAQSEARIALSYVTVRLRQGDSLGAIELVESPVAGSGRSALKLDRSAEGGGCLYIYFKPGADGEGGRLVEVKGDAAGIASAEGEKTIAEIQDFLIEYGNQAGTAYNIAVLYDGADGGAQPAKLETHIALRTGAAAT